MHRRATILLSALIVVGLVLSSLTIPASAASHSGNDTSAPSAHVGLAAKTRKGSSQRNDKNNPRKQHRKTKTGNEKHRGNKNNHAANTKRAAHEKRAQRVPVTRSGSAAASNPARYHAKDKKAGLAEDWRQFCSDGALKRLPKSKECTHGSDPAPPGFDVSQRVLPLSARAARTLMAANTCDGDDGESGFRVQVLYVRDANLPSRYAEYLSSIRGWAGDMNEIFQASAEETGPTRSVRFVTNANCQPTVEEVTVTAAAAADFDPMIAEIKAKGYNRTDRIYLSFVDTTTSNICGIATLFDDDRANGSLNWNNVGPSFARVDAGCWSGDLAGHEVMHTLGGVQNSAPHTTFNPADPDTYFGGHCIDEWDIMCYSDVSQALHLPPMEIHCPDDNLDVTRFDCGDDDYYNTSPASGTYLANFWNPANNRFLTGAPEPLPPDVQAPHVAWVKPVANDQTFQASTGTVNLEATASDDVGVARVEFWRFDNAVDEWVLISTDTTAPYTSSIDVATLGMGFNQLTADAYDATDNWRFESIFINRAPPPDTEAPQVSWTQPVGNSETFQAHSGAIDLSASATDNVGVARVEFRRFDIPTDDWVLIATDTTAPYHASVDVSDLSQGNNELTADAYDAAGNWHFESIVIDRVQPPDSENPVVQWTAPAGNNATFQASSGTVDLRAAATDNRGVDRVEFWRFDDAADEWILISSDTTESYASSISVTALAMGSNELSAEAYDTAGNSSAESIFIERVPPPDTVAPTVQWTVPVGNDETFQASEGAINLRVTATDDRDVARVAFLRFDSDLDDWVLISADTSGPYAATIDVSALDMGSNELAADAYDAAGNVGSESIVIDRVPPPDNEPPAVQWTAPVGNDETFQAGAGSIRLAASAADNAGVVRVEFLRFDREDDLWLLIRADDTAPFAASIDVAALSVGANELVADAYDAAGNSSRASIVIQRAEAGTINPPAPAPSVAPPAADDKHGKKKGKKGKKKGKKKRR
jgi:hypothetical protein